ncbi:hypothetical protein FA13DRAFT_1784729 [Coprinellus micaceus]|uniref:Uncharacterized protein n=1 Tax=Coprinellus micaceus TaxID=71717 RepID=A0A4Y7U1H2_COPMI|nr:hypothetical protein FA13DRAFT_1784729 [Coprinellus micaceus]
MPPQRPRQEELDDDGFDILASQNSSNSDDTALEKALLAHYAAAKEKKRQEKERKFMEQASVLLLKDLSKASDDIQVSSKSIEAAFSKFLNDYAAVEDRIHHLWTDVVKEHQKLEVGLVFSSQWTDREPPHKTLIQRKYDAGAAMEQNANKQHISALSKLHGAREEFEKVIAMMVPGSGEEGYDEMDQD